MNTTNLSFTSSNSQVENKSQYQHMNMIYEGNHQEGQGNLYLGDEESAKNLKNLRNKNVKTVITCGVDLDVKFGHNVNHITYEIMDHHTQDIYPYINQANNAIYNGLQDGSVLVHCAAGMSRSAAFVIAFMMVTKSWGYLQALNYVKSKRYVICPNRGFCSQLKTYDKVLSKQKKDDDILSRINKNVQMVEESLQKEMELGKQKKVKSKVTEEDDEFIQSDSGESSDENDHFYNNQNVMKKKEEALLLEQQLNYLNGQPSKPPKALHSKKQVSYDQQSQQSEHNSSVIHTQQQLYQRPPKFQTMGISEKRKNSRAMSAKGLRTIDIMDMEENFQEYMDRKQTETETGTNRLNRKNSNENLNVSRNVNLSKLAQEVPQQRKVVQRPGSAKQRSNSQQKLQLLTEKLLKEEMSLNYDKFEYKPRFKRLSQPINNLKENKKPPIHHNNNINLQRQQQQRIVQNTSSSNKIPPLKDQKKLDVFQKKQNSNLASQRTQNSQRSVKTQPNQQQQFRTIKFEENETSDKIHDKLMAEFQELEEEYLGEHIMLEQVISEKYKPTRQRKSQY